MKIGIITDSIREQSTGIGYFTKDIVTKLLKIDATNEYFFIDCLKTDFNKERLIFVDYSFKYYKNILWHALLPKKIRNRELDFILNFTGTPHFLGYRQKEIFFVYDISWYLFPQFHPKSRAAMYKWAIKRSLKNCFKIVTISESTKQDLINVFHIPENKIEIIYPSFTKNTDTNKEMKNKPDHPYILFISTLEPRKNIESIIKAFRKLKEKHHIEHKLIICGKKGWMYEEIFNLIHSSKQENDIIYKGYITNEEKAFLYKNAEFFVYPSFYEGFGIPVLEAMSYGCPVVTSNVSSLPEVAGNAGIKVDPKKVDELVLAMGQLVSSKGLREKLRNEGYKQVKKLDNSKQIERLLSIMNDIEYANE